MARAKLHGVSWPKGLALVLLMMAAVVLVLLLTERTSAQTAGISSTEANDLGWLKTHYDGLPNNEKTAFAEGLASGSVLDYDGKEIGTYNCAAPRFRCHGVELSWDYEGEPDGFAVTVARAKRPFMSQVKLDGAADKQHPAASVEYSSAVDGVVIRATDDDSFAQTVPLPWPGELVWISVRPFFEKEADGAPGEAIRLRITDGEHAKAFGTSRANIRTWSTLVPSEGANHENAATQEAHKWGELFTAWQHLPGASHYRVQYLFRGNLVPDDSGRKRIRATETVANKQWSLDKRMTSYSTADPFEGDSVLDIPEWGHYRQSTQNILGALTLDDFQHNGQWSFNGTYFNKLIAGDEVEDREEADEAITEDLEGESTVAIRVVPILACAESAYVGTGHRICNPDSELVGVKIFSGRSSRPFLPVTFKVEDGEATLRTSEGSTTYTLHESDD